MKCDLGATANCYLGTGKLCLCRCLPVVVSNLARLE
jgi:hypothetical protein